MEKIKLTGAEIRSNKTRVDWAEGLIAQLPVDHDGRNSWLLNYGKQNEAIARRDAAGIKFNEEYQAAEISPKEKPEGEYKNNGLHEKAGNTKLCNFEEIPYGFNSWLEIWKLIKEAELKQETDIIEFRVAILNRSFFVTKKQIIDYTAQEMELQENACKRVPIMTAKGPTKEKTIGDLTEFELQSLILSTLEKFLSSKFHK